MEVHDEITVLGTTETQFSGPALLLETVPLGPQGFHVTLWPQTAVGTSPPPSMLGHVLVRV